MYSTEEMFKDSCVGSCEDEVRAYRFIDNETVANVREKISALVGLISSKGYAPKFYAHISFEGEDRISKVKLTLKLSKSDMIDGVDTFKATTEILWNKNVYFAVAKFIGEWVDRYNVALKAMENAQELTDKFAELGDSVVIRFVLGDKLVESIDNTAITIGLSAEQLGECALLDIFSDIDIERLYSEKAFREYLMSLTKPIDILRRKFEPLQFLGLNTRVGLSKLTRKAYRKVLSSDTSVVGVPCRVEADGYFALVKRVLADEVADDDVIMSDGTYAYISVLDPVGKDDVVLTDMEKYAEMVQRAIA